MLRFARTVQKQSISYLTKRPTLSQTASLKLPDHYDIVVTGGGITATTLALALAKAQALRRKSILLLTPGAPHEGCPPDLTHYKNVAALSSNSVDILRSVGAWDLIEGRGAKKVKQVKVWNGFNEPSVDFYHDHLPSSVEYVVESNTIMETVYDLLCDKDLFPNVSVRNHSLLEWLYLPKETGTGRSLVGLQDGSILTGELVIGTDAFDTVVRSTMGVDIFSVCHGRVAIVAKLEVADAGDNSILWERFLNTGSISLLPLGENVSSVVWNVNSSYAKKLLGMKEEQFVQALNHCFHLRHTQKNLMLKAMAKMRNGNINPSRAVPPNIVAVIDDSRSSQRAEFSHTSVYARPGVALAGDAAHRIHPYAGQGINLGFTDIKFLVESVSEAATDYAQLGEETYLKEYERNSMAKNVPIIMGMHGVKSLYTSALKPVVLMRTLGLKASEIYKQLKYLISKRLTG